MEQVIDHQRPRYQKFQETLAHVFQYPSGGTAQEGIDKSPGHNLEEAFMQVCGYHTGIWYLSMVNQSPGSIEWAHTSPGDKIGPLAFMAFQEQQFIGQDLATRGEVKQKMVRGKHGILYHLLESRGYEIGRAHV